MGSFVRHSYVSTRCPVVIRRALTCALLKSSNQGRMRRQSRITWCPNSASVRTFHFEATRGDDRAMLFLLAVNITDWSRTCSWCSWWSYCAQINWDDPYNQRSRATVRDPVVIQPPWRLETWKYCVGNMKPGVGMTWTKFTDKRSRTLVCEQKNVPMSRASQRFVHEPFANCPFTDVSISFLPDTF